MNLRSKTSSLNKELLKKLKVTRYNLTAKDEASVYLETRKDFDRYYKYWGIRLANPFGASIVGDPTYMIECTQPMLINTVVDICKNHNKAPIVFDNKILFPNSDQEIWSIIEDINTESLFKNNEILFKMIQNL